jgi:hypothetical protein
MHGMPEQAALSVVKRNTGFIAGGFDAENFHRQSAMTVTCG